MVSDYFSFSFAVSIDGIYIVNTPNTKNIIEICQLPSPDEWCATLNRLNATK